MIKQNAIIDEIKEEIKKIDEKIDFSRFRDK